ncbi:hypothetical protein HK105_202546 [Polyrhizophydium stewartii]|uniref:PH domain-containing protein n=1 Tax=Polyrhizophydium stewartii TaxID=2732419 RepID=A0ABR4NDS0_9FUNG
MRPSGSSATLQGKRPHLTKNFFGHSGSPSGSSAALGLHTPTSPAAMGIFGGSSTQRDDWDFTPRPAASIVSLQLPPSIPSLERMSPELWAWIHACDIHRAGSLDFAPFHAPVSSGAPVYTRVFSPAGDPLEIPKHLLDYSDATTAGVAPAAEQHPLDMFEPVPAAAHGVARDNSNGHHNNRLAAGTLKRRKPVPSLPGLPQAAHDIGSSLATPQERAKFRRFFLQIVDLHLKQVPQGEHVIGVVTVSGHKRCTSVLPLFNDPNGPRGYPVTSRPLEGFLFDVPETQPEFVVNIRLYTKSVDTDSISGTSHVGSSAASLHGSPSIESFSSHASSFKRPLSFFGSKRTAASNLPLFGKFHERDAFRFPASPTALGTLLGEVAFTLPTFHAFSKVTGVHSMLNTVGKKEIAKINLQMGMVIDEEYWPEPEVPLGLTHNEDFINFLLMTPGGLIWRKYFVVAAIEGLYIFDPEYRQRKKPIAWLPFSMIVQVSKTNVELMAAPSTMLLTISLPWQSDERVPTAAVGEDWRECVVAGAEIISRNRASIYIAADSRDRAWTWAEYFSRPQPQPRGRVLQF